MKKTTLNAIATLLNTIDFADKDTIMAELNAELNKDAERKAESAAMYEQARDAVLNVLRGTTTPLTAGEIFAECESDLPEGFTRNKVSYGLLHYWQDSVVKIDGKVNTYRLR